MFIDFLIEIFKENSEKKSIVWNGNAYSYSMLLEQINEFGNIIEQSGIIPGTVVAVKGDFSPKSIALLLSLIESRCIILPLAITQVKLNKKLLQLAQVEFTFNIDENETVNTKKYSNRSSNDYYEIIRKRGHPGIVMFTSGTSGEPKGAVHDFFYLLEKFKHRSTALNTLNFMLFDHWGGLNTMFYILSNGGTVITVKDRSPKNVCKLIETHKIELLPTSPTFLNILLLGGVYENYDLSSLKIISYGTEPMLKSTLKSLKEVFPNTKLKQTYGLIELGVLRSESEDNSSLWVKIGGAGYQIRVIEGLMQIKAESAMLGYLNAPSPFTHDGWFKTGDKVLQKGEYFRILGRKSEMINVGGEKVYPQEVENVIQQIENVAEVTVFGEKNPITGNIVCAKVSLLENEEKKQFVSRLKKYCSGRLQRYKIPIKVKIVDEKQYSERFKKVRS